MEKALRQFFARLEAIEENSSNPRRSPMWWLPQRNAERWPKS